jgi:GNAT superfamily N-acetyltransferase
MHTEIAVEIRPFAAADAAPCRACLIELQEAERRIDPRLRRGEEVADAYLEQAHARCREYTGVILVAEVAGEIVGMVTVMARVPFETPDEPPGEYAVIPELVVRDAYRHRGIGSALLQAAEQHARTAGASELRIRVLSGNHAARRLYVREGFGPYLDTLTKPLTP